MTETARGLTINVYRRSDGIDCTNNGYTAQFEKLTLVGIADRTQGSNTPVQPLPKGSQVMEPSADAPAVILVKRQIGREVWSIEPAGFTGQWFMMGGNYAATSDGRFGDITGIYGAVAVHDRVEGARPAGY